MLPGLGFQRGFAQEEGFIQSSFFPFLLEPARCIVPDPPETQLYTAVNTSGRNGPDFLDRQLQLG